MKARNYFVFTHQSVSTQSIVLTLLLGLLFSSSLALAAAPEVTATATGSVPGFANAGTVANLTGNIESSDGSDLTFLWTQNEGDSVDITNPNQLEASFLAPFVDDRQTLIFRLSVTDANSDTGFADVSIDIGPSERPVTSISFRPLTAVLEGSTVTIGGQGFFLGKPLTDRIWEQTSGPTAPLSSTSDKTVTFVAPEINNNSGTNEEVELGFKLTVVEPVNNISTSDSIVVAVADNGITGLDGFITTQTADEKAFGVRSTTGDLVALAPFNINNIPNSSNQPRATLLGLVKLAAKPDINGVAVIEIKLTETIPDDYAVYSYSDITGADDAIWEQLNENQYSFSADRDVITLRLQDAIDSTNSGDRNADTDLIEVLVGPGQLSPRAVAGAVIGGGSLSLWSLMVFAVLVLSGTLIGRFKGFQS